MINICDSHSLQNGYVTCSHGTDCHAESPAGNLRSGVILFFFCFFGSSRKQITEIKREGMITGYRLVAFSVSKWLKLTEFTLGSRGYFFSYRYWWFAAKSNREPYQTVSTVYFILGILRTDLWSQGTLYPTLWLEKATLQWENPQEVRKTSLDCKYLLLCVSKLEVFTQLLPAYHENPWTSMVSYKDFLQ